MIQQTTELSPRDQTLFAAWLWRITLLYDIWAGLDFFGPRDYACFRARRAPLRIRVPQVWIGRFESLHSPAAQFRHVITRIPFSERLIGETLCLSGTIGHLAYQVLASQPLQGIDRRLYVQMVPRTFDMVPLVRSETIRPNNTVMTQADFMEMSERWVGRATIIPNDP